MIFQSQWRKVPPTVAEVAAHQWWWWNRQEGVEPHVLQLDVDTDAGKITVAGLGQEMDFNSQDWGGDDAEWAPCRPPA